MARKKIVPEAAETTRETIVAFKGFNADFCCTPNGTTYQYEVGKTYRHDGEVKACGSGFHACEHPLDVLRYYGPAHSRFAVVDLAGEMAREKDGDSKIAAAEISIKAEIRLPELIQAAVKYVLDRVKWIDGSYASGEREAVRTTKTGGAATASGDGALPPHRATGALPPHRVKGARLAVPKGAPSSSSSGATTAGSCTHGQASPAAMASGR